MSKVLIVGNVLKDVYLNLDGRGGEFELDGAGVPWLDVAFNGGEQRYFRRSSVFAGAAVTLEVLENFKINAKISGVRLDFKGGELESPSACADYRYILCYDDKISYLVPSQRSLTKWETPKSTPDWIFIDRSAVISRELTKSIISYLSLSKKTRLAIYLEHGAELSADELSLAKLANLIFTEEPLKEVKPRGMVCRIAPGAITMGTVRQKWQVEETDLMTHLTMHSVIAGTVFASLLVGKTEAEALQLAKLNVERASLTGTLTRGKLEEMMDNTSNIDTLRMMAKTLVAPGKGILAADESGGSIHKKFEQARIPDDEQHRRDYRNIFFTTPDLEKYVNGVILFDETARQESDDGRDFVSYLTAKGIVPGIKVDQGLADLTDDGAEPGEKYTQGLDDLPKRLNEYYAMGLRFAKWRAAFEIVFAKDGTRLTPTDVAVAKNCEILAQYALACQEAGIVPIVEPEVVYDGDYGPEVSASVTGQILDRLFEELNKAGVDLGACILKCNMVLAGKRFGLGPQSTPAEVGELTAGVLRAYVPKGLAGVVFLSGGQSVTQATDNLQAVTNNGPYPWPVTFSFARALQDPALEAWNGDNDNADAAREAFAERLKANSAALKKQ